MILGQRLPGKGVDIFEHKVLAYLKPLKFVRRAGRGGDGGGASGQLLMSIDV